jgi:hypothetical protein
MTLPARAQIGTPADAGFESRLNQSYMPAKTQEIWLKSQNQALNSVASTPNISTLNTAAGTPMEGLRDLAARSGARSRRMHWVSVVSRRRLRKV